MTPASFASGRYVVDRRLGLGGMAVVFLARDTALDRPVAVKVLAEHVEGEAELRERFLQEARYAAALSHPNVVGVYDTGEEDGLPYIVMEYVEGVTLADELTRRRSIPATEVAAFGVQACAGLAHAHDAGLVHRDVKPQNLLLRDDGTLKVADFGIARGGPGSTLTQAGTLLGTAAFMAPEVARGETATPASDLYSLGAVLYELVTGGPPRRVVTLTDLLDESPITPVSTVVADVPPALDRAIMRALALDPRARPASAAELGAELETVLSEAPTGPLTGATVSSRPTVPLGRPARVPDAHRGRSRASLAGAAVLTAFALLLMLALGDDDERNPVPVEPVPIGSSPAEQARNLADWLRQSSR